MMGEEDTNEKIQGILKKFKNYLDSAEGKEHFELVAKEKKKVKELMQKLDGMDKNSDEFFEWILYGLLPYYKTEIAKRVSLYPSFMNIKSFFNSYYSYSEDEWKIIANKVYDLCKGFQDNPKNLPELISEFTKDKYSRRLQCGSITPILYSINDKYPIVNNRVRWTYEAIMKIFGKKAKISQKLMNYPANIEKIERLIKSISSDLVKDYTTFDVFCYWYDEYILSEEVQTKASTMEDAKIEEVNYPSFIKEVDTSKVDYIPHSLRNPERIKLRDIIANVLKRWALPNFQRYFDWGREDVRSFLESIFNDYYVGAFLLWEGGKETGLDLIPIKGMDNPLDKPEAIILDGQQRITSIYYAIKAPNFPLKKTKSRSYYYINFRNFFENGKKDLVEVRYTKHDREECFQKLLFPLFELEDYKDWIDKFEEHLLNNHKDLDYKKLRDIRRIIERRLNHIWDGYEIPYIMLPDSMKLKQVTDIFENINTKGKPLSVFDLLIARLLVNKIQLRNLWDETKKEYSNIKRYFKKTDKIPIYILQAISLSYHKVSSCSREDVLNIYDNIFEKNKDLDFEEEWDEFAKYLDMAIEKIESMRGYGADDEREVPFIPMLPILAALLRVIEGRDNKAECYKKLDMWYWSSVFSNAYSSAVDSRLTSDFKEMKNWFEKDTATAKGVLTARRELMTLDFREVKSHGSSMYKGILCLLALQGARDMDTNLTFEQAEEIHLDHLFPKSKNYGFGNYADVDSILNMTWMSKTTNTKIKRWKKPSVYVPEWIKEKFKNDEKEFKKLLRTHFIDDVSYECMLKDEFESFLDARNNVIMNKIKSLIGWESSDEEKSMISPDMPFSNRMAFYDAIKKCTSHLYWVDKYFSNKGLRYLSEAVDRKSIKEIKILMAIEKVDESFRSIFKDFKKQMKNEGIEVELRVIIDNKLKGDIHDRWIISKHDNFNIPSPDIIARGQFSEIKKTQNTPPFEAWWDESKDIIHDWNCIVEAKADKKEVK